MKTWIKYAIGGAIVVVLITGFTLARKGSGRDEVRTVKVERGDVKQEVLFTGKLKAQKEVALGFELGGTVTQMNVEVGEKVTAGQVLARVDSRVAGLELAKAKADEVAAQEQKYLAWQTAETDLAKTKAENVRALEKQRQAVRDAKKELDQQREVVDKTQHENGGTAAAETSVLTQRVKESAYNSAQQALSELQKTVEKSNTLRQQATQEAKATYDATVQASGKVTGLSSLGASRQLAAVKLAKSVIYAPFSGVVTAREVEEGEYVSPGTVALSLATVGDLELAADVPETDAAKLSQGASATVTFDVYGSNEQWQAEVVSIAPAAKVIEGVPTFEVKLQLAEGFRAAFAQKGFGEPRPGLTANIVVHSAARESVIALPRRAVVTRDGKEYVKLVNREIEVKTGLLGSDGRVEIVSGLSGGEEIIISNGSAGN